MRTGLSRMVVSPLLSAMLGAASFAMATAADAAADGPPQAVVVTGRAALAADGSAIVPALDPLFSPNSAASCNFMGPYNPNLDPVTVAYMQDFGMLTNPSYDRAPVSESAPFGDASTPWEDLPGGRLGIGAGLHHGRGGGRGGLVGGGRGGFLGGGCGGADYRFAAGRMHIAAHDKSLTQAFTAFNRKDYAQARALFTEAWNKVGYGGIPALMLARLDLYGLGAPQDTGKAVDLLERVADASFDPAKRMRFNPAQPDAMMPMVEAAWLLAQIYDHGIGTAPDRAQADRWYGRAADLGFVPALDILALRNMAPGASPRARAKALGQLRQAADAGYAPAQFHLARLYYNGDGVPRDLKMAGAYFDAAAHAGVPAAQFAAGRMIDLGQGVPADPGKALVYYKDAALKGDRDAEFALGTYFYGGEVVAKNPATARKWFAAAAQSGQPDAMFNLGVMNARGEGGARDPAVAYVWLSLAAQSGQQQAVPARDALARTLSADERKRAEAVLQPKVASTR